MTDGQSHRSDYVILVTLGLISAAAILALVGLGYVRDADEAAPVIRTTRSTNVAGTMACYALFERLGVKVRRSERPLLQDTLDTFHVLFLLDPIEPLESDEAESLRGWVRRGGVLVCTDSGAAALDWPAVEGPDWPIRHRYVESDRTPIPAGSAALALARDVKNICLTGYSTITDDAAEPWRQLGAVEPLLADSMGLRIAARTAGRGCVIAISDSSFLANGWIGKADNAILAANLVCYARGVARGGQVAFDEYHFGYGRRPSRWTALGGMLFGSSPGWAILAVTVAGVLFLFLRGRRFGTRRAAQRVRRRSKLEFIHSVGATYRAAGANRLTLRLIFNRLNARCAEVLGLPETARPEELASSLAHRTGRPRTHYEAVFASCKQALAGGKLSGRALTRRLGELAEIESEIIDGRANRT